MHGEIVGIPGAHVYARVPPGNGRPGEGVDMMELRFTGGGPLDGRELAAARLPGESIAVAGGRYTHWGTVPSSGGGSPPVAFYEWIPAMLDDG
jgi:hypothetical protein